jgi:hypothetical protein
MAGTGGTGPRFFPAGLACLMSLGAELVCAGDTPPAAVSIELLEFLGSLPEAGDDLAVALEWSLEEESRDEREDPSPRQR